MKPVKKCEKYEILLTKDEIEDLVSSCYAQIESYCTTKSEMLPFKKLIEKLENELNK